MLKNTAKQMTISGVSSVSGENGQEVAALAFYSTIQPDGKPTFNQAVNDMDAYEANMNEADADFAEFKNIVMRAAKTYKDIQ